MAVKTHDVSRYNYSYDARRGGPGQLQLWGTLGKILDARFVDGGVGVPAPVPAPDLNSATAFFAQESLTGLIALLRTGRRVTVTIDELGPVAIRNAFGLADSRVVCSACAPDLLAAKTQGILEAMRRVVAYCGADAPSGVCPITFHLSVDSGCGDYQPGVTTGYFYRDAEGLGAVCLYDVEKQNRILPFTVANAATRQDQLLPVHEAMHGWFVGRQQNYRVQEPFCKWVSFWISEAPPFPDLCGWFASTPDAHADALMKYLCQMGMTVTLAARVLASLARSADQLGRALSDQEFAALVSEVFGQDAVPAFQSAGILP